MAVNIHAQSQMYYVLSLKYGNTHRMCQLLYIKLDAIICGNMEYEYRASKKKTGKVTQKRHFW